MSAPARPFTLAEAAELDEMLERGVELGWLRADVDSITGRRIYCVTPEGEAQVRRVREFAGGGKT